jgi:hypothetical protein
MYLYDAAGGITGEVSYQHLNNRLQNKTLLLQNPGASLCSLDNLDAFLTQFGGFHKMELRGVRNLTAGIFKKIRQRSPGLTLLTIDGRDTLLTPEAPKKQE